MVHRAALRRRQAPGIGDEIQVYWHQEGVWFRAVVVEQTVEGAVVDGAERSGGGGMIRYAVRGVARLLPRVAPGDVEVVDEGQLY